MTRTERLFALVLLVPALACGKRGDPRPPLRKTPQPLVGVRIAQRADRLEISGTAPRVSVDGVALKALTVEILRLDGEGDFLKVAKKRSFTVRAGEPFTEPETMPAPGTVVRITARAAGSGKVSTMTNVLTLPVQPPPSPPFEVVAAVSEGGVQLKWSGKRPTPLPTPTPAPPVTTPASTPPGTPATSTPAPAAPAAATPATTAPTPTATAPAAGTPAAASPTPQAPTAPPAQAGPPPHVGAPTLPGAPMPTAVPAEVPIPKSGFWVYRRTKAGRYDRPLFAEPTSDKSHLDETAGADQDWCYVVRAVVSHEPIIESANSNEVCLTARDIAPPTVPSGLTLLAQTGGLELRWSPSPEADLAAYRVYRATPTGAPAKIGEVAAGTAMFLDTTTTAGTAYRYTVTAVDRAGNESAPSAPLLGNSP
jgi:hypothetical protein